MVHHTKLGQHAACFNGEGFLPRRRVDEPMCQHMETEGLEFLQFSFRWVNCLLLREIPFQLGLRLWDTYLAEGPGMKEFLIYALAAFLLTWDKDLKQMDFQVTVVVMKACACFHQPDTRLTDVNNA